MIETWTYLMIVEFFPLIYLYILIAKSCICMCSTRVHAIGPLATSLCISCKQQDIYINVYLTFSSCNATVMMISEAHVDSTLVVFMTISLRNLLEEYILSSWSLGKVNTNVYHRLYAIRTQNESTTLSDYMEE